MRFVGVDLAWGRRNGTGVCALDHDGRVISSGLVGDDDQLCRWLAPHVNADVLIGVDAPLIVSNQTGCRPCESLVNSAFGGRGAGAHPSNRSMPLFADGGRAWHLARRLKLSTDPRFAPGQGVRRIIEVYPHPAIVSLFGLRSSLKYKAKRGRSLAQRRVQFSLLRGHLESLDRMRPPLQLADSTPWQALQDRIDRAPSHAGMNRAEDELDAYVCAYVAAYYWHWGTARCTVFGNHANGYIVTPVDAEARRRS